MRARAARRHFGSAIFPLALAQVYASPAAADDAQARASRSYEDARKAFDGGAYQAAAVGFERVFQEIPNGASMLAASRAWEKAGEPALAADDFRTALSVGDLRPDEAAKAKDRLSHLEAELGWVQVLGPDGTVLSLAHVVAVRTPAKLHARPGPVTVIATLPDGSRTTRSIVAEVGNTITVDLRPPVSEALPPPPDVAPKPEPQGMSPVRTAAWITGGGAVAAGITAAILAPIYKKKDDDWNAVTNKSATTSNIDQYNSVVRLQVATDTAFLGACGLAVASAVLFLVSLKSTPTSTSASSAAHVSMGPGWIGVAGSF
jgi:hypothetical protein